MVASCCLDKFLEEIHKKYTAKTSYNSVFFLWNKHREVKAYMCLNKDGEVDYGLDDCVC